jgi:hypothetical protein
MLQIFNFIFENRHTELHVEWMVFLLDSLETHDTHEI